MKPNIRRVLAMILVVVMLSANASAIVLEQISQAEKYMLEHGLTREAADNILAILHYTDEMYTSTIMKAIMEKRNKLGSWEAAARSFGVEESKLHHYVENKVKTRAALTIPDPVYYEMVDEGMTDDECRDFGMRAAGLGLNITKAWEAHKNGESLEQVAKAQKVKENEKDRVALEFVMRETSESEYKRKMRAIDSEMTDEEILKYAEELGNEIVTKRKSSSGITEEELAMGAQIGFNSIPEILELCQLKEAQNTTTNLTYAEMIEFVKNGYSVDDVVRGNVPQKKIDALRWAQMLGEEIPVDAVSRFDDLEGYAWAKDSINSLARGGIIRGTTENEFSPKKNITRADFALLLVRAFKLSSDSKENFSDISVTDYFAFEVAIARNNGIISGIGDNKFSPRSFITRQDMMVIAHRAFEKTDVELLPVEGVSSAESYRDFEQVKEYATDAVSALVGAGIVNGKDTNIEPSAYTTRAEVAVLIDRMLAYIREHQN